MPAAIGGSAASGMRTLQLLGNTGWNLAGHGVPIIVAVAAMPLLIHALGEVRFGILALGWLVTGYFALFDFGVGRATTRFMSILRKDGNEREHAVVFWSSLSLHAILGLLGGLVFALAVPWLVSSAFSIPPALSEEALSAFRWLAFSVPALIFTSALRGALESAERFDMVNAVKIPASMLNYLAPLLVLQFSTRIDLVIALIALSRWLVMAAYSVLCARAVVLAPGHREFDRITALRLMSDGGWLTVASLVAPLMMAIDRLLIARLCSLEAVTYYVVPYEVITKLWIFSASLLGAAFPLMSVKRGPALRQISERSFRWLLFLAAPFAAVAIIFGRELLSVWVGERIAAESTPVLQFLAVGVLLNVLAQVPLTTLQAAGHAAVVAKLQLIELPLYAVMTWWLVLQFGVVGAAAAWAIRAFADGLALSFLLSRTLAGFRGWPWKLSDE